MTELVYLALAFAFAIGCNIYDATMTEKGLAAGLAVEENTWLVGSTPKAWQLYARDIPIIFLASALSIIGLFTHNPTLFYAGLAGPIVAGAKHIVGGREWAALLTAKK